MGEYNSQIVKQLQTMHEQFYDDKRGTTRTTGSTGMVITRRSADLLTDIFDLCLNTKYTNEETKQYIKTARMPITSVWKLMDDSSINKDTVVNKIYYCNKKMVHDFGNDIMNVIRSRDNDEQIERYEDIVAKLRARYVNTSKLNSKFVLDLEDIKINSNGASLKEIDTVLDKLEPYRKSVVNSLLSDKDKDVVGYIMYILETNVNTKAKNEIREHIVDRLGE